MKDLLDLKPGERTTLVFREIDGREEFEEDFWFVDSYKIGNRDRVTFRDAEGVWFVCNFEADIGMWTTTWSIDGEDKYMQVYIK